MNISAQNLPDPSSFRLQTQRFSDFKTNDGITLPTKDAIHFTEELQNGITNVYEWDLNLEEISNNQPVDPRNFQVK